ncbi:MAG TPA: DUF402 domain-containing protein [Pyrinomonadaceae bacterium]|jgi:hypothetical protein
MQASAPDGASVFVHARKFDGRLHRQWPARLTAQTGSLIVLDGVFAEEVNHPLLGRIAHGTLSTEYYWTDRWYSVFRFREPAGHLRNYYCNINQPATFDGRVLSFIDLDIDVLVAPDFTYQVLDEDEFARHAAEFNYTADLQAQVRCALAALVALIERREFPFAV